MSWILVVVSIVWTVIVFAAGLHPAWFTAGAAPLAVVGYLTLRVISQAQVTGAFGSGPALLSRVALTPPPAPPVQVSPEPLIAPDIHEFVATTAPLPAVALADTVQAIPPPALRTWGREVRARVEADMQNTDYLEFTDISAVEAIHQLDRLADADE